MVPPSLDTKIIKNVHLLLLHGGETKTFYTIHKFLNFPQKRTKIANFIKLCKDCQLKKDINPKWGRLVGTLDSERQFSTVSTDLYGPINLEYYCARGQAYIITFIDFLSRTVALAALRRTRGRDIVAAFKDHWLSKYPMPNTLHSDCGPQFASAELQNFCRQNGIKKTFSIPYNPTANSKSERINQSLKFGLRLYRNQPIEMALTKIEYGINLSYHRMIGISPFECQKQTSPFDPLNRKTTVTDRELADRSSKKSNKELDLRNAKRRGDWKYKEDDFVFCKAQNSEKHADAWKGPYRIIRVRNEGNTVQVDEIDRINWYNLKQLKPAYMMESLQERKRAGCRTPDISQLRE